MKNSTSKQYSQKLLAASVLSVALFSQPQAAPLPNGTLLTIGQGLDSATNIPCSSGSCFGLEVAPGLVIWTNVGPGTDGGFVVGKNQASGGQELAPSAANATSGELTAAWNFFANFGTFFTPNGVSNVFSDTSCAGPTCIGVTVLNSFNYAQNSVNVSMGSATPCKSAYCSAEELAGDFINEYTIAGNGQPWGINFHNVVPDGDPSSFGNVKFTFLARGAAVIPTPIPTPIPSPTPPPTPCVPPINVPVLPDILLTTNMNQSVIWGSLDSSCGGIISQPTNGTATLSGCQGTYTPLDGFSGNDTLAYDHKCFEELDVCGGTYTYCTTQGVNIEVLPVPTPTLPPCPIPPPTFDYHDYVIDTTVNNSVSFDLKASSTSGDMTDLSCSILSGTSNGTVTQNSMNSCNVTYTPNSDFVGQDSLGYEILLSFSSTYCYGGPFPVGGGDVTINVNSTPTSTTCEALYPQTEITMIGKGKNLEVEETMTTTFKGNIVSTDEGSGKVTICRGSTVSYEVVSTVGTANCTVKHGVSAETTGTLNDKGKLVCTNKPDGKDTDKFKIKRSKNKDIAVERRWFR